MKKKAANGPLTDDRRDEIIAALKLMESNSSYETKSAYRGASHKWTNNYVSFVDYHLNYLKMYPALDPEQYISNLRLILSKRS